MAGTFTIAPFLGERRKFELRIGEAEVLEDELDCGVMFLEAIFRARQQKTKQMRKILTFGLIGGGMGEGKAIDTVEAALTSGKILQYVELYHIILVKFIGAASENEEDEDADEDGNFPEPPQDEEAENLSSSVQKDNSPTPE